MTKNPQVSIILVSHNRLDLLRSTLRDILENITTPAVEIILVDNASTEPVVKRMRKEFPEIQLIVNKDNVGFGKGNNIGAQKARGEYLLFANTDLVLQGNPVPEMIEMFEKDSRAGIIGCQLYNSDGSLQPSFFRFPNLFIRFLQLSGLKILLLKVLPVLRFNRYSDNRLDFVSGAFFLIKRSLFFDIGCFDDRYFMYLEDADLGYQVANSGKRSLLVDTGNVVHLGAYYENIHNAFVLHQMNRGLLLFYKKNYPSWKFFVLALMSIVIFYVRMVCCSFRKDDRELYKRYGELIRLYSDALANRWWFGHEELNQSKFIAAAM